MNELLIIALLIFVLGTLPLIFVGYQIAFNNKHHWINGVDLSQLSNPEAFARITGHSVTLTGVLIAVIALLLYIQLIDHIVFLVALTIVPLLPLSGVFYAKRKYS